MNRLLKLATVGAYGLALSGGVSSVAAQDGGVVIPEGGPDVPLAARAFTANLGTISLTSLTSDGFEVGTASETWEDFSRTSTSVSVPPGQTGRLLATFSANARCYGNGAPAEWCAIRILVDGVEMSPRAGMNFAFASPAADGFPEYELKSIDRISVELGPGSHSVVVQGAVVAGDPGMTFGAEGWQLTLVLWRAS